MALFIGSFNPPTLAHLNIALSLKKCFHKIIFIPVNSKSKELVNYKHRVNMLSIYKKKYSFIEIDEIMKNYSYFDYRILDILNKKYHDNNVIIGGDLLKNLKYFDNYEYLLENYIFYSFDLIELNNNCQKDHSIFHIPHLLIADLNHNH